MFQKLFFTYHVFVTILLFSNTASRRRTSSKNRQFEARPGMGGLVLEEAVEDKGVAKEPLLKPFLGNLPQENVKNDAIENMQKNTYETVNEGFSTEIMQAKRLEGEIL